MIVCLINHPTKKGWRSVKSIAFTFTATIIIGIVCLITGFVLGFFGFLWYAGQGWGP